MEKVTIKKGLSKSITEYFITLKLTRIKIGEMTSGVGKTLHEKILRKISTFIARQNREWITIKFGRS